jgi:Carboxypeptidase regulatory-like domain
MASQFSQHSLLKMKGDGRRRFVRLLLVRALPLVLGPFILAQLSHAQTVNASLDGSVTDPSGAGIPEATITALNVATGAAIKTKADATGNYLLPSLPPATYNLTVEKPGFKTTVISGVTLLVDQHARVDAQLQVGAVTTSVEVNGAAPLVETKTASVGTVIGEQQVRDLPLNLRRLTSLAELVPGTVDNQKLGYAVTPAGSSPFGTDVTYTAGGARDSSNTLLLDGMESRAWSTGGFAQLPPPDAVQEFKIQTNIYAAAFGKTAGSTMNLVTKSGTNQLHGDVYEYLRNNDLDARNFFATNQTNPVTGAEIPGSARPEYRRNQFGATLGGPIRKNKIFLFGYYDGLREIKGLSLTNLVPTDTQKTGDFSSVLTGQTMNLCGAGGPANLNFDTGQLFNPATEKLFTCPAGSASAGSTILVGSPVPGNIITNIDPVAQKVLAADPEPNRPGFPNYVNQTPRVRDDNQFGVRFDYTIGPKDQFFFHYLFSQSNITDPSAGYTTLPTFGAKIFYRGQNILASWVHTFGPSLLNEVHVGFARNNPTLNCVECPRAPGFVESFGITNLKAEGTSLQEGFPYFAFVNFAGVGDEGYVPITNVEMVEKLQDNLTWTHGRHTVMAGVDLQNWQDLRQQNPYSPHGQFTFNGQYSSLAGTIPNVGGISDLADLELGYPSNAGDTRTYTDVNQVGGTFDSFYGQDDIKVTRSLNLNIGLRWEFRRPPVDKSNNIVQFIPTGPAFSGPGNGLLVTALPDAANDALCTNPAYSYLISASGQCLVASSALRQQLGFTGRTRRTIVYPYYRDFAPRFGLTWAPGGSNKIIVRTGYGIFYDLGNLNILQFVSGNPIFSQKPIYTTAFGSPPPLTNGLPTTTENVFASPNAPPLSQQYAALWVTPNFQAPRVQMWSFGIQSQLSQNWALEANYIGTKANHLDDVRFFFNQPEPGVGDLQPRRPYPDFNVMAFFSPDDNSFYNALQVKLTKRFANGFSLLGSYTYAKALEDGGGNENYLGVPQDDNNREANWGRTTFDARQRLAFSYIWQLPFGKGKRWLNERGVASAILGDWQVSGIWVIQTGLPFTVLSATDFSNTGSQSPRPDRTCSGVGHKTVSSWFDTSCFNTDALSADLASGQPRFGNSGHNILDGPGLNNWDFSLMRNFRLGERFQLEFQAAAYNIFNQAHFGFPVATVGNPNIGQLTSATDGRDIQFGMTLSF